MKLIIAAELSRKPSEILYFRFLTLISHDILLLDCLLETLQEKKDIYYHYLQKTGALDYIEDIITPAENEFGLRLSKELEFPLTIRTKEITAANCNNLLGQIKTLQRIDQVLLPALSVK